ncbi:sulfatase [Phaeodactylibacter xiamenensis]|uniref:sulfatase family protein n=1 Tax=Phaeodactylibacter xiamenensis TaxID=1524460 RepID=UPI003BACA40E
MPNSRSIILCFLVPVGALLSFYAFTGEPTPEKPNVVIIFTDDLGYGDLGCYGNAVIRTPHLDQMAAEGARFTEFYSISPVCSPSRAGLLTGRYPIRMGIQSVFFPESWTGMAPEEITLAEALKEQGYTTSCVGKWHLGHHHRYLPLQQGFDEYFGIPYSNDMAGVVYMEGNEVVTDEVDQRYTTRTYTEKALDFIDRKAGSPFFLYVAHSMPHVPLYASEDFEGKSPRGLYGDVIEEIDWSVGQILEKLKTEKLEENTIVIFTSDNGPWLAFGPDGGSAGPLREGKQFTFEGGMRVPGIIQWKGQIEPMESEELVSTIDLFPTLVTLAGGTLPDDRPIDGQDISAHLLKKKPLGERTLAYYYNGELRAFRKGDWKIKMPYPGNESNPWRAGVPAHDTLLFNLKADRSEKYNILPKHPEKAAELLQAMEDFQTSLGTLPPLMKTRAPADNIHYDRQKEWLEQQKQKP